MKNNTKILFVCKANRFRSKSAEALFNKYNEDKNNEVKSAGVQLDVLNPFVAQNVINESLIKWADKIIITADNVSPDIFPKEKKEVWLIKDASENDRAGIKRGIDDIENRIKEFLKRLRKTNL